MKFTEAELEDIHDEATKVWGEIQDELSSLAAQIDGESVAAFGEILLLWLRGYGKEPGQACRDATVGALLGMMPLEIRTKLMEFFYKPEEREAMGQLLQSFAITTH